MERFARYCWSLAVAIIGYFAGMLFLASYHTFDDWQVGLAGFTIALIFAVPTYLAISRVAATANRGGVRMLAFAGGLFFFGSFAIFLAAAFH